ncbi:ParB family chromosome partitioning protein [Rudaeicoccus suwonensis]|uniref:ParB family chromosome partitioning protein n=1 Tax=Rudaeicoccus suwonensis TaxID=657409 RepID=A0A561EBU1_9MICO|nr:ParB family chromosome partitioning protein [Rudaeicoccus suwonensis]
MELDRTVESIQVGYRVRRDLGDLTELCASIHQLGLLQPITITPDGTLVCGARRLAAVRQLGWGRVKVWITSTVSSRLAEVLAEQHENTARKPLTPTEAAALYTELKRLYAEDAARRQQATQFTADRNPRHQPGSDGGGKLPPPSNPPPDSEATVGKARQQAARAITGRDSSRSLDHVSEVQRLADDPATPKQVREIARRELAGMEADGTVYGHYLTVRAAASTVALGRLADDPAQPEMVRVLAAGELDGLDLGQPPAELVKAAQAAIARATNPSPDDDSEGLRLAAVKHYGLRAFLTTVDEMDGWWRHYDPAEIAAGLSEQQWQRLRDCLDGSVAFIEAIATARTADRSDAGAEDRPPRAATD